METPKLLCTLHPLRGAAVLRSIQPQQWAYVRRFENTLTRLFYRTLLRLVFDTDALRRADVLVRSTLANFMTLDFTKRSG
jgi:hypothetical protein